MRSRLNNLKTVEDVAAWQLCCGCGACASTGRDEVEMIDTLDYGRRPVLRAKGCGAAEDHPRHICPGIELDRIEKPAEQLGPDWVYRSWGPVLGVWEGHARDEQVRFRGASGGIATALGIYALEQAGMHGVLHTRARQGVAYLNETTLSTDRDGMIAGAGSRYAPASPCDGLELIEQAPGPCVFIGKPCDVAGAAKASSQRQGLADKIGLTVAFFCAGTPTTRGTHALLGAMGVQHPGRVKSLRYRGQGWPGRATVEHQSSDTTVDEASLSYEQSWGDILSKHRQWRCFICPDHIGEYADIAVADAWHRSVDDHQPGRSVVIARTHRGLSFLHSAMGDGAVELDRVDPGILPRCRPGQARAQGELWARLVTLRALGIKTPEYRGFDLFQQWREELGFVHKVRSILSTAKRVWVKKLYRRRTTSVLSLGIEDTQRSRAVATSG